MNIYKLLQEFRNSEIPADRLFYLNAIKQCIKIGENLNKIKPSRAIVETLEMLKEEIKDYKIYPKL